MAKLLNSSGQHSWLYSSKSSSILALILRSVARWGALSKFDGSEMFGKFLPTFTACWCLLVFSLPQPSYTIVQGKDKKTSYHSARLWFVRSWATEVWRSPEILKQSKPQDRSAARLNTSHGTCKALKRLIRREQVKIIPRCACYCTTPWIWDKYGLWHLTRNALGFRADCNHVITSRTCHFLAISCHFHPTCPDLPRPRGFLASYGFDASDEGVGI